MGKKLTMASRNPVSQSKPELPKSLIFFHSHIVANLKDIIVPDIIDMLGSDATKQIDATDACSQLVPLSKVLLLGT